MYIVNYKADGQWYHREFKSFAEAKEFKLLVKEVVESAEIVFPIPNDGDSQ